MKVLIASDHAGFKLKEKIIELFSKDNNYDFINLGPHSEERVDYPDFAINLCEQLKDNELSVLVCGSGQGVAMTANKFPHIRAALCTSLDLAELSRAHNNANVLCLGSRTVNEELNLSILKKFLATKFEGGRHQARVDKMKNAYQRKS